MTPVDPVATSQAQTASNKETAEYQQRLNMVGTTGPDGTVNYEADPTQPGGYRQVTTLSPAQQAIYGASTQAQAGALGVANDQLGRVSQALGQPLNTSSLPALVGGVGTWGQAGGYGAHGGQMPAAAGGGMGGMGGKAGVGGQAMPSGAPSGGPSAAGRPDLGYNYGRGASGGPSASGPSAGLGFDNYEHRASAGPPGSAQGGNAGAGQPLPPGVGDTFTRSPALQAGGAPQGVPNVPNAFQPSTLAQLAMPSTSGIQTGVGQGQPLQYSADQSPLQTGFNPGASLQYGYDPGQQVQGHVGPQDLNSAYQSAANASYQQAASRLDPQYAQQQQQMEARLAAQGLSMNDDAYKSAADTFSRGRNDAYAQAQFGSQAAGLAAQNQLFGQSVQQGQFANAAAGQQYAQSQGQAAFHNATAGQDYSQNRGAAEFTNQALGQQFQQNVTNAQLHNAAAGQGFQQTLGAAQFGNDAQQQGYGQKLSNVQNLAALQNQGFNQYQTSQNQGFNQGLANAQLSNTARNQGLQEQAYIQNQPINQFTALMGSGQVSTPQGISYSPTQVNGTDVLGAYALNQQGQIANAQMKSQAQGGMMSGLMGLGSAAIMASDRRLKTDIRRFGTRRDGLGVYAYRYRGEPGLRFGVMAQEVKRVRPDAVIRRPDGFLAVNYMALEAA